MNEVRQVSASDEIRLRDVFGFLKRNSRLILLTMVVGAMLSAIHLVRAPKLYEAKWQMRMAQFVSGSTVSNIEEITDLAWRLQMPLSYPVAVAQTCGMPADKEFGDYLDGSLEVLPIKNVTAGVEMKFRATSTTQAGKCAEAIVMMIAAQQRALIDERMEGIREQILGYQQSLREEQQQLEVIKKSELGNFGYLAKLDKLSRLHARIDTLQEDVLLSQRHPAKLVLPVFVSSKPVSPKAKQVLAYGLLFGLMSGVLFALWRELWRKIA